jgi:hypothetical protein
MCSKQNVPFFKMYTKWNFPLLECAQNGIFIFGMFSFWNVLKWNVPFFKWAQNGTSPFLESALLECLFF